MITDKVMLKGEPLCKPVVAAINGRALGAEDNMQPAACFQPTEALYGGFYLVKLGKKKYHLFELK